MLGCGIEAKLIKTCSMGLNEAHLGKTIEELYPKFVELKNEYGFNMCGEGGEYETAVLDCPLFKKKCIAVKKSKNTKLCADEFAPLCTMHF